MAHLCHATLKRRSWAELWISCELVNSQSDLPLLNSMWISAYKCHRPRKYIQNDVILLTSVSLKMLRQSKHRDIIVAQGKVSTSACISEQWRNDDRDYIHGGWHQGQGDTVRKEDFNDDLNAQQVLYDATATAARRAGELLGYLLMHSTKWNSEPNNLPRRLQWTNIG